METRTHKTLQLNDIYYDKEGYVLENMGNINKHIVCIRPGHKSGLPQIYLAESNQKYISHNYGHSGVGWSILFGSVNKSINNIHAKLNIEEEINIIGLGCMGLLTAITLYYKGYKKIKLVGEAYHNTASFNAGGLIEFSLSTIYNQTQIEQMNILFKESFLVYKQIAEGKHPFIPSTAVKEVDYYTDFYQEGAGLGYLADIGIIDKPKRVKLRLGNNKDLELWHFRTYHVVTQLLMDCLYSKIKGLKIPVELKKLNSFDEISTRTIFNCSGLGSYWLNNDKDCYPICGHGFTLSDEAISKHDYILRLTEVADLKDSPYAGALYFMPKTSGFIGGSYMKGYDGKDSTLNLKVITNLLERSKYIFNGTIPLRKEMKPKF